jgi:PUA domain protein
VKKQFNKSQVKELNEKLQELYGLEQFFAKKDIVELHDKVYVVKDRQLLFFYRENVLIPSLSLLLKDLFLKKVVVDMGAVRFVVNGADIMRPGIVQADQSIQKEEPIVIVDQTHGKPLAVGLALLSGVELMEKDSGKVVANIHYVGDKIWDLHF